MTEESFEKRQTTGGEVCDGLSLGIRKHIDLVIRAIAAAKRTSTLSLDIYMVKAVSKLNAIIKELNAEEYIQLKGHSHAINTVYIPITMPLFLALFQKDLD